MAERRSIKCLAGHAHEICARAWRSLRCWSVTALLLCAWPAQAQPAHVRVSNLSDVPFGTISNFSSDAVQTQDICVFSNSPNSGYRVTASGSGIGGAFALGPGSNGLQYEVQWNSSPGQSSGAPMSPGVPLAGLTSSATQQFCNSGPPSSASLIVVVRSSAASSVTAGEYSGTLTLIVGAE